MARRRLTKADKQIWQAVAATIDPLPGHAADVGVNQPLQDNRHRQPADSKPSSPPRQKPADKPGSAAQPAAGRQPATLAAARPLIMPANLDTGQRAGISAAAANRLKTGKLEIEGRLDLHGHTRVTAQTALVRFVSEAVAAGKRQVLVITGKGSSSNAKSSRLHDAAGYDDGFASMEDWQQHAENGLQRGMIKPGVLRQAVPQWLNEQPLSSLVIAFCTAKPRDGGSGALYLQLRRPKRGKT